MMRKVEQNGAAARADWAVVGMLTARAAGALLALACALWRVCLRRPRSGRGDRP